MSTYNALVERARLDEQHKQSKIVILGNLGIGTLTALFYSDMAGIQFMAIWYALLVCTQIVRYIFIRKYLTSPYVQEDTLHWLRIYGAGSFVSGCCWGVLGSILVIYCSGEDLVVLTLALIGLTGGNIASTSYWKKLFYLFATPALVPASLLGLFIGDPISMTLGAFGISLWLLSYVAVTRLNESIIKALTLGFVNQTLVAQLEKEKTQLQKINEHLQGELQKKLHMTKWLAGGADSYYSDTTNTDISNHDFRELLADIWEQAIENQQPLSMAIFQIDVPLKDQQANAGDYTGDRLEQLKDIIHAEIGGDNQYLKINDSEFALILSNMSATDATSLINRIRTKLVSTEPLANQDEGSPTTLSFGVAGWVPDITQHSGELITACRRAKNLALEQGGNRVNIG